MSRLSAEDFCRIADAHRARIGEEAYVSVIPSRSPQVKGHRTLGLAKNAVSQRMSWSSAGTGTYEDMTIWSYGANGPEIVHVIPKGTKRGEMPWQRTV